MTLQVLKESPRGVSAVPLQSERLAHREIFLNGSVSDASVHAATTQLMYLNAEDPSAEITLYINTPGGDVRSGLVLFDVIAAISAPVRTVCMGLAGSMGAIIFLAGTRREMLRHSQIMIHDPSFGDLNIAGKKPHELSTMLEELDEVRQTLISIIANITGKPLSDVAEMTRNDTYVSADQALEMGFATAILTNFTV